ncbi:MAG: DUF3570 domain-containing protein [Deltaproteobacteria bacterium]|nr:DUF3570 domain-containing protein [Deltaproteobacteria bacterium]
MMKQTSLLAILLLLFGTILSYAEGLEEKVTYSLNAYRDNSEGFILTNKLGMVKSIKEKFAIGVNGGVDAITAASSSNKSDRGPSEKSQSYRSYASLSGIYDDRENSLILGGYLSEENDYSGRSLFINYVRQLNRQNTSLAIALSTLSDRWKINTLPRDDRKGTQADLSITQFLSPTVQFQLGYSNIYSRGYLASPYRFIEQPTPLPLIEESLPASRRGEAYSLRVVKALSGATSLNLSYRYYRDDWKITSHTINTEVYRDLRDNYTLGGRLRLYRQSDTAYTKDIGAYTGTEKYVPIDYKYSAFDSYMAGVNLIYTIERPDLKRYVIKGSLDYYRTSNNDFIKYWYHNSYLDAVIFSCSVDYLY